MHALTSYSRQRLPMTGFDIWLRDIIRYEEGEEEEEEKEKEEEPSRTVIELRGRHRGLVDLNIKR